MDVDQGTGWGGARKPCRLSVRSRFGLKNRAKLATTIISTQAAAIKSCSPPQGPVQPAESGGVAWLDTAASASDE